MKILIVDDEIEICNRLQRELQKEGHEVEYRTSPLFVLDDLKRARRDGAPYNLLLLNVHMPEMDGITLLSRVRKERLGVEVIIMTGYRDEEIVIKALRLAAKNYLNKPISLEELDAVVSVVIKKTDSANSRRYHILVVDDEKDLCDRIKRELEREGYHVAVAYDGDEGLNYFKDNKVDIVIADIRMPRMSGLEMLENCRKITDDFVSIIITGHGDHETAIEALRLGVLNYLRKPISLEELFVSVDKGVEMLLLRRGLSAHRRELEIETALKEQYAKNLEKMVDERTKALRESEEKYRTLFEDSKDVVYISTIEGKFLDINSTGVEFFGYDSKEELLKVNIAKDFYLNPYDRKKFIQTMEQQGFVKDYELLMRRKDGEILILLSTATPYRDKEGKITEYRGIMRDVTHQKKLEQQLLHAQKMESVGQLAGGVAHDFNNILQAIIGYASLLKMKIKEDDPLRRNVDQILASSERAANLTQSLLAFSRKQIINLQPVKINEIVKRVEKLLLRIIGEDIELKTILNPPPPPFDKGGQRGIEDLIVMADSGQIEQVLMNLATNARDAMPNGGSLTVETEIVELDEKYIKTHGYGEPGVYALISFTDTGVGMDEKTKERIFEPFFTTKEVGKGTGLGLSMVYGIIKQHNGYINAYSELGKGTTFKIYLPLTKAEVVEIKPTEPAPL